MVDHLLQPEVEQWPCKIIIYFVQKEPIHLFTYNTRSMNNLTYL